MAKCVPILLLLVLMAPQVLAAPTYAEGATPYVLRAALLVGASVGAVTLGLASVPVVVVTGVVAFVLPDTINYIRTQLSADSEMRAQNAEETYNTFKSLDFENLDVGSVPEDLIEGTLDAESEAILNNLKEVWQALSELEQATDKCKTKYHTDYAKWEDGNFNQSLIFTGFKGCLVSEFAPMLVQFNKRYDSHISMLSKLLEKDYTRLVEVDNIGLETYNGQLLSCVLPMSDLFIHMSGSTKTPKTAQII